MIKTPMKKAAPKKSVKKVPVKKAAKKSVKVEPLMQILATSKCQTLSGKSTLTYQIAIDDKENIFLRITGNDGGGFWSKEYVLLSAIINTIESVPDNQSITSVHFLRLFVGKSQNSYGFLLAILLKEGLLEALEKKRQYRKSESGIDKFLAKIDELKSSKG